VTTSVNDRCQVHVKNVGMRVRMCSECVIKAHDAGRFEHRWRIRRQVSCGRNP